MSGIGELGTMLKDETIKSFTYELYDEFKDNNFILSNDDGYFIE